MYNLLKNERLKLYKKTSTWVTLGVTMGLTLLLVLITSAFTTMDFGFSMSYEDYCRDQVSSLSAMLQDPEYSEDEDFREYYIGMVTNYRVFQYILDNNLAEGDWRIDLADTAFRLSVEAELADPESVGPGEIERMLAEAARWTHMLAKGDWRAYAGEMIEDPPGENLEEKEVYSRIFRMYLEMDIEPVSTKWDYSYEIDLNFDNLLNPGAGKNWKASAVNAIGENELSLLRGEQAFSMSGTVYWTGTPLSDADRTALAQKNRELEVRLRQDIPPVEINSFYGLLETTSQVSLLSLAALLIAAVIIAGEFTAGTVKLLLIVPHRRARVFWAKTLAAVEFAVAAELVFLVISMVICGVTSLFAGAGAMQVTTLFGNTVTMPYMLYFLGKYLIMMLPTLAMVCAGVMFSALLRSSVSATVLSLVMMFGGDIVLRILMVLKSFFGYIPGVKFLIFANLDLSVYFSSPLTASLPSELLIYDSSMTLGFSAAVLAVYMAIFLLIAHDSFVRRDVK
ncbi:MAG: ABC transporter permease [Oscillospiraceae bacterium]|nr:ABC transporter permease [Oscillospiraceae bacterium]